MSYPLREVDEVFYRFWSEEYARPPAGYEECRLFHHLLELWRISNLNLRGFVLPDGSIMASCPQLPGVSAKGGNLDELALELSMLAKEQHRVEIDPAIIVRALEREGREQGWCSPGPDCADCH